MTDPVGPLHPPATPPKGGLRVAHVSDLHILHIDRFEPWRFVGKRITGGANLLLKRKKAHSTEVVVQALEQLQTLGVDQIVVTGDLSNLSLDSEFAAARQIIEAHGGGPERVSVIPGNHDRYTYGSALRRRFESCFSPFMASDLPTDPDDPYPWVRLIDPGLAIVGICTSIPSPPLLAVGRVGSKQRDRLNALLRRPELQGRFILAAMHHHLVPPRDHTPRGELMHGLIDANDVMKDLLDNHTDLVIHGHNHQHGFTSHLRPDGGTMHICEAGSTSVSHHRDDHYGGKFNLYDLAPDPKGGKPTLARITTFLYRNPEAGFTPWKLHEPPFDGPR